MFETLYDNKRNKLNETEKEWMKKNAQYSGWRWEKENTREKNKRTWKEMFDVEAEIKEETTTNQVINIKISLSK